MRTELARLLGFTAENLLRLGVVIAELENRGEDLTDLKIGLLPLLRDIAAGVLLPEVVVQYAGRPKVMKQIAAMPVDRQAEVLAGTRVVEAPPATRRLRSPDDQPACTTSREQDVRGIAKNGTPRDVGDMAAELILGCVDQRLALERLLERLGEDRVLPRTVAADVGRLVKPKRVPLLDLL